MQLIARYTSVMQKYSVEECAIERGRRELERVEHYDETDGKRQMSVVDYPVNYTALQASLV